MSQKEHNHKGKNVLTEPIVSSVPSNFGTIIPSYNYAGTKYYYEYIWIDAFENLRSKIKILDYPPYKTNQWRPFDKLKLQDGKTRPNPGLSDESMRLHVDNCLDLPEWNFDGSSTGQAKGYKSDVILKPVYVCRDPFRNFEFLDEDRKRDDISINPRHAYLVLCETYNPDGTPHITNTRYKCKTTTHITKDEDAWFGIEQEYIIYDNKTNLPLGWLAPDWPSSLYEGQGPYYCGVGGDKAFGRHIAEKHLEYCLSAGLKICGINAEVTPAQWEFQLGPLDALEISDQLWLARYILNRITEEYSCTIEYHPKPMEKWNGSGAHTNFSTKKMREPGGIIKIIDACEKLRLKHAEHLEVYGNVEENKLRLTGNHETASFDKFTYGVSDRGASIRIPLNVHNEKCGYLEDRRPSSRMDPYLVTERILRTVCLESYSI
jgi:glutamine synthetase